jgi:hypothetical protein
MVSRIQENNGIIRTLKIKLFSSKLIIKSFFPNFRLFQTLAALKLSRCQLNYLIISRLEERERERDFRNNAIWARVADMTVSAFLFVLFATCARGAWIGERESLRERTKNWFGPSFQL